MCQIRKTQNWGWGADSVAQQIKLLIGTSTPVSEGLGQNPGCSTAVGPLADTLCEAEDDGSSTWISDTHTGDTDGDAGPRLWPGSTLMLQALGEWVNERKMSLFLYLSLLFSLSLCVCAYGRVTLFSNKQR